MYDINLYDIEYTFKASNKELKGEYSRIRIYCVLSLFVIMAFCLVLYKFNLQYLFDKNIYEYLADKITESSTVLVLAAFRGLFL